MGFFTKTDIKQLFGLSAQQALPKSEQEAFIWLNSSGAQSKAVEASANGSVMSGSLMQCSDPTGTSCGRATRANYTRLLLLLRRRRRRHELVTLGISTAHKTNK
jgi:hypothetical protein